MTCERGDINPGGVTAPAHVGRIPWDLSGVRPDLGQLRGACTLFQRLESNSVHGIRVGDLISGSHTWRLSGRSSTSSHLETIWTNLTCVILGMDWAHRRTCLFAHCQQELIKHGRIASCERTIIALLTPRD